MSNYNNTLTPQIYLQKVKDYFDENGHPEVAEKQRKYMRDQFEYYGLKAPKWVPFSNRLMKEEGIFRNKDLKKFVRLCFEEEHREVHYVGLQMVERAVKKEDEDFIEFIEELILNKSWWDTVDWISKFVGFHFQRFPHQIIPKCEEWLTSENIWLQRTTVIFQRYKKYPTNEKLLFENILRVKHINEFFIQKAIGWALRDHSKEHPQVVIDFIKKNKIEGLAKREGLKWIKKMNGA